MHVNVQREMQTTFSFWAVPRHILQVPYGVWLEAMAACLPFRPSLGSWRSVNQVFDLVTLEPPPSHVGRETERYVDYVKFLERYVGELSSEQEEVQANVTHSISERLFQQLHDDKTKSMLHRLRRDADGKVALEDLASCIAHAGWGLTKDQLERLLRPLDHNRDGRVDQSCVLRQHINHSRASIRVLLICTLLHLLCASLRES